MGRTEGKHYKESKSKILKLTATVAVLASLAAGMLFGAVDEITPELKHESINQPPIVMDIDEFGNAIPDGDDDEEADEKKGSGGIVSRIKQAIASLPLAVRLLIITPLWAIGTVLMTAVSILGRTIVASPIGAFILSVVVGFGVLVGLLVVTAKTFFPNVPIKKILTKNNLITLLVVAVALAGADAVAPLFWAKYPLVSGLVKFCIGALVVLMGVSDIKQAQAKLGLS